MNHKLFHCIFIWLFLWTPLVLATPQVVVTLKPIHSLVSYLMQGTHSEPTLLIPDGASPHTFQLKPSALNALVQADLIIWVGPELEQFLSKVLESPQLSKKKMTLITLPGLELLPQRHDRAWQHQDHEDHDHHSHSQLDPHIWLSTTNATVLVHALAHKLAQMDPQQASLYLKNGQDLSLQLIKLKDSLQKVLAPIQQRPFLVYHDGYQYFEKEFHLNAVGTLIINPQLPLSAYGLRTIQDMIQKNHIQCVFRETEFNDSVIRNSLSKMNIRVAELDPLGARLPQGPHLYEQMLENIAKTMSQCLNSPTTD